MELHTKYTFTMPQGTISDEGIRLIKAYIDAQSLYADNWKAVNPTYTRDYLPLIPQDWQWTWLVAGKGEYVGTFPKRLSKFYFQEHAIKCPTSFVQELGNLARKHSSEQITFTFDFTDTFDWESGDFGDDNSCYFTDRRAALGMLAENDALAIRFYESEKGIGRAWLARLSDSRYIVFNGYGIAGDATLKIAQIMATWLGLGYKHISLENYGQTGGTLWINGGNGYLIGTSEQTAAMTNHDLQFDCDECYSCDHCGEEMSEDDSYSTPDGESYCQSCFYEYYDYCAICDETFHRDNMNYIEDRDICNRCLERRYDYCNNCEEYRPNDDFLTVKGEVYCTNCQPEEPDDKPEF